MPVDIKISDEDIAYAEKLLLPSGKYFDEERQDFIKCLETVDLQAVPGSGKTTVLLAKLLILDRKLPFPDGGGILVISHTNAAVNEIRSRIGKVCPDLFLYPNFVGTIQSFVDTFAAIPCFIRTMGHRPSWIDADAYDSDVSRYYRTLPPSKVKAWLDRKSDPEQYLKNLRLDQELNLIEGLDGKVALQRKSQSDTYKTLFKMKRRMFDRGLLHFEDVYLFAQSLLENNSLATKLLRKRFHFVFVDEMQDMSTHQRDLLEEVFGPEKSSNTIFQRIGDTDQAIFGGTDITDQKGWKQRDEIMTLSNSQRLSPMVARILAPFAFERREDFHVNGLCDVAIKPHIIIYDDDSVDIVVERFSKLILDLQRVGQIPINADAPFKAVAWNSTWKDVPELGARLLRLIDFCPSYQRSTLGKQEEFDTLADYLIYIDPGDQTLASARKAILAGVVRALRLEDVVDPRSQRPFTITTLVGYFMYELLHDYDRYKLYLYRWSINLVRRRVDQPLRQLQNLIPKLIKYFGTECKKSMDFLLAEPAGNNCDLTNGGKDPNKLVFGELEIYLGTVHSVKGQTHTATLYIESSYQKDGTGTNAKRYESQRLAAQFKGNRLPANAKKRIKESARMVYVGFSRPTHLLAFAVHKDRFDTNLRDLDSDIWEIVNLSDERKSAS